MNNEILILGSDQNAYYMARCVYEAYHKKAYLIGQRPLSFTTYSSILNISYESKLWEEDMFLRCLDEFSKNYKEKIILISTNETYTKFISKNKNKLKEKFLFNVSNEEIIDSLIDKEKFYKTYKNSILDLPKTIYIDNSNETEIKEKLEFPVVLKTIRRKNI